MPDDSLLAGRTVAPSKPDNGAGRNSSGLSTDLVKIYKVCEFAIPSTFYYRFGVKRNPRTITGIMPNGKVLLVAVDGHKPGYTTLIPPGTQYGRTQGKSLGVPPSMLLRIRQRGHTD
jgi:hypothetical protein